MSTSNRCFEINDRSETKFVFHCELERMSTKHHTISVKSSDEDDEDDDDDKHDEHNEENEEEQEQVEPVKINGISKRRSSTDSNDSNVSKSQRVPTVPLSKIRENGHHQKNSVRRRSSQQNGHLPNLSNGKI